MPVGRTLLCYPSCYASLRYQGQGWLGRREVMTCRRGSKPQVSMHVCRHAGFNCLLKGSGITAIRNYTEPPQGLTGSAGDFDIEALQGPAKLCSPASVDLDNLRSSDRPNGRTYGRQQHTSGPSSAEGKLPKYGGSLRRQQRWCRALGPRLAAQDARIPSVRTEEGSSLELK